MDSKQLALLCRELADNKKAENLLILDVRKLSSVTDYFVLASGGSAPHLRAIVNEVTDQLKSLHGLRPRATDGNVNGDWVVLDYFDVILHVMRQDVRERYDLESLWGDAPRVNPTDPEPEPKPAKRKTPGAKKKTKKKVARAK